MARGNGGRRDPVLDGGAGTRSLLLGNEAIVRGALEAGVGFAAGYPGTPSSEITDTFARISKQLDLPFEYSVNEKIALEMAFAASLAGVRAMVAMKHLGLSSAGDPLTTIPYIGTVGGLVIVSAGDPSCATSPNEQDQRQLADMLHLLALDPSTPQEALELTRFAFELSEKCQLPVLLRPTARLCHGRAEVHFGPFGPRKRASFVRAPARFIPTPNNARRLRREIDLRLALAREMIAKSGFVRSAGQGAVGVLSSGVPSAVVRDVLAELGLTTDVVRIELGAVYPLPDDWLAQQLAPLSRLLIVEELSPFLEDAVRALAQLRALKVKIFGKRTGHLPEAHEYGPRLVGQAIRAVLKGEARPEVTATSAREPIVPVPPRPPVLCAGCPHRSSFFAAKSVFGDDTLYFNDIGCYTLGADAPLDAGDALLCMGAGFTLASGVARVTQQRTVGFMGDSTFFHSGMPALLNAVKERANVTLVILDNSVTAMTGFQTSPAVATDPAHIERGVDIATVARALGATHVEKVDPADLSAAIAAFNRAKAASGPSVIVCEHPCPVFASKVLAPKSDPPQTFQVDPSRCATCGREAKGHRCQEGCDKSFERVMASARAQELVRPRAVDVAPCASRCPLFLCVQGYATHIAAGNYPQALSLIMSKLPLPESVCRVCHRPCEDACVRRELDGSVAINDLKRFVVEWANQQVEHPYRPVLAPLHGHHVAVVGAGPSGLAAAHELRVRGYEVSIFDEQDAPGGTLRSGIPAYRLPKDALDRDVARILGLGGITFSGQRKLGQDLDLSELLSSYSAVYLALGARYSPSLGFDASVPALDYLADHQRTDRGKTVLVVGGGNSAVDSARTALRRGARQVRLLCLESREEMPAIDDEIQEAVREGVELLTRRKITQVNGRAIDTVQVAPRNGRWRTIEDLEIVPGTGAGLDADVIVSAIGQRPDRSALAPELPLVWCGGWLSVDEETGATAVPRLFGGGDLTAAEQTVTHAIAAGLRAAWGIDRQLRGAEAAGARPPPPLLGDVPTETRPARRSNEAPRHRPRALAPDEARQSFVEAVATLDEASARAEAERCMICGQCGNCRSCVDLFGCPAFFIQGGRVSIDPRLCSGCAVCADFCPNGAIQPAGGTPS